MANPNVPMEENEVIIHVPQGTAKNIQVVEVEKSDLPSEITVKVSRKRKSSAIPLLGVIVK